MNQQNVFRVAAVIYAGNNYEVSPRQIHRKVIQDALYNLSGNFVSIGSLAEYINENYSLLFSPEEIMTILTDKRFKDEFDIQDSGGEYIYQLTEKRRTTLSLKQKKTLQDFIHQYLQENNIDEESGKCILQYLYNMFTSNVDSFERLLQVKTITIETNNKFITSDDAAIINGFLDWDNDEKNIEIFNLACYALEYCMLTINKTAHFSLDSLRNKTFYLDTNILYRAIGINGDDRKRRTLLFLSKFKSLKNEIKLTKSTLEEFEISIKNNIKKLRKSESPAIHSSVYSEYVTMDDIWRYFHVWRAHRSNGTVDYFANFLQSEFQNVCNNYSIETDDNYPFTISECEDELKSNAAGIKGLSDKKTFETAYYDAQNVKWIECKRTGADKSIFDAKYFFLSSDSGLRFWDVHYHSKNAPIVIMPSQWFSIILRYMERTSDDFKSFVCFLNIKSNFDIMSEEQIHYVLQGISEVTTDIEQQRCFLRAIIENDFMKGAEDASNFQIKQIAKKSAERLLQSQLEEEKRKNESLEDAISDHSNRIDYVTNQLEITQSELNSAKHEKKHLSEEYATEIDRLKALLSEKDSEVKKIKTERDDKTGEIETYKKKDFNRNKRTKIIGYVIIISAIVGHIVWYFNVDINSKSYMSKLAHWINGLDDARAKFTVPVFALILTAILVPLCVALKKECVKKYTSTKSE